MKTKEKLGCIILMIPFILLVIWIRWSNYNDEIQREKINNIQQQIDSIPDGKGRIDMLNMLYEMDGLYRNERYLTLAQISIEHKQLCNLDSALIALKRFEDIYEKSLFTTIYESQIRYMMGDKATSCMLLKNVINENIKYQSMNWINKIFMQWLNSGHDSEYNRYYDYLYDTFCQLYALGYYRYINHDTDENYKTTLSLLERINEMGNIIQEFISFEQKFPQYKDYNESERRDILMSLIGFCDYKSLSQVRLDIVGVLCNMRTNIVNDLIIETDSIYGKSKSKQIIEEYLSDITSINFTDLLFIKAYKKYIGINDEFPTKSTYEQYKSFPKKGYRYLTLATPFITNNPFSANKSSSALIDQGILESFVVLSCNNWNIRDSILFNSNYISNHKGMPKNIVMLKNDYSTDTICILNDKIGAMLNYVPVPEPVYQMLLYDFFN